MNTLESHSQHVFRTKKKPPVDDFVKIFTGYCFFYN